VTTRPQNGYYIVVVNKRKDLVMRRLVLTAILLGICSSCSVVMASKKEGVNVEQVRSCRTRAQLLACGATIVSTDKLPSGELVETYQIPQEKGSTARAVMHGLLDVATFGIWEAAGTPIEGSLSQKEFFIVKVYYNKNEEITKMELL
jgi:hypothetical protein